MSDRRRAAYGETPTAVAGGRFVLQDPIATGATSRVFRAWDGRLEIQRAVKVLDPVLASRPRQVQRFLAEATTMARFNHPNILRVFDVGEQDGHYWMVMELASGGTLLELLGADGRAETLTCLDITLQVLAGLGAAHAAGVVHRDVKPNNVLLDERGRAMLSDFGVARPQARKAWQTITGESLGTWSFMAPEQRSDARLAGVPADIYGVGATLYALVSGRVPPDLSRTPAEHVWRDMHPAIRHVVEGATTRHPEDRYPSAAEMAARLRLVRDKLVQAPAPSRPPAPARRWRSGMLHAVTSS